MRLRFPLPGWAPAERVGLADDGRPDVNARGLFWVPFWLFELTSIPLYNARPDSSPLSSGCDAHGDNTIFLDLCISLTVRFRPSSLRILSPFFSS